MARQSSTIVARPERKQWLFLLLAVAGLYVLLPQLGVFRHSFSILGGAHWPKLAVAMVFTALTYFAAGATYCLLALRKLSYVRTVLVELASMLTNRLLPAGIGGMGANYAYLRGSRHSSSQAASVVAANNLLGFVGHLLLVGVLLGLFHNHLGVLHLPQFRLKLGWLDEGLFVIAVIVLLVAGRFRRHLWQMAYGIAKRLFGYRQHPIRLGAALLTSASLTLCNVLSLYFCATALGINLPFVSVLLVFSLGIALGTATPTPGGLGGVEAGLVAGMVAYHTAGADALAAVLAYRLISYWLALALGALAFVICQRRGYFLR